MQLLAVPPPTRIHSNAPQRIQRNCAFYVICVKRITGVVSIIPFFFLLFASTHLLDMYSGGLCTYQDRASRFELKARKALGTATGRTGPGRLIYLALPPVPYITWEKARIALPNSHNSIRWGSLHERHISYMDAAGHPLTNCVVRHALLFVDIEVSGVLGCPSEQMCSLWRLHGSFCRWACT